MLQKQNPGFQQARTRTSSLLNHVLSKRTRWFSLTVCLAVLLVAAVVVLQQNPTGVYAASMKKTVSAPKHAPSASHLHHAPVSGKTPPVMSVSPSSMSFTISLAQPHSMTQTFMVKNSGVRPLFWHNSTTVVPDTWVVSSVPAKGSDASQESTTVTVTVKPLKLGIGTHITQLAIVGTDREGTGIVGGLQTITITLVITA